MNSEITTEGDKALKADIARELFNVDGTEVKIGIISTSFNAENKLSDDVTTGELPGENSPNEKTKPVQILKDIKQDSPLADDEGRALAQIIHDIAPGAELSFHTFIGGEAKDPLNTNDASYAEAVNSLVESGVDVIVDDSRFPTTIFQDGEAAQAVNKAVSEGVIYVPAAYNNGNISYESEFRPGKSFTIEDIAFEAHDFDPSNKIDLFQNIEISKEGTVVNPLLSWDEPIDNATSAYEMFLLSSPELPNEDNIVSFSTIPNEAALDDPLREFSYAPQQDEELYLLIAKQTDSDSTDSSNRIKWISAANGADRTTDYEYIDEDAVNNTVFGPANAEGGITVGATDIDNPLQPRKYSSQGGAPILFDSEGNRLAEPIIREKPNVFAVDGVSTAFSTETPFNPFNGTSAAAPHVAGIVALMLERAGGADNLSPEEVRSILQNTALPVESEQTDAGLVQADKATINSFTSQYIGTEDSDFIEGTKGAENFYGKGGDDVFRGFGGSDYFLGEHGNDILLGGSDNDVLVGGEGYNILEGGGEKDTFVLSEHGVAVISDFELDHDTLAIEGIEDASGFTFSAIDDNSTIVENGENTLAFLSNVSVNDNLEVVSI